jgi:hypothetical protein
MRNRDRPVTSNHPTAVLIWPEKEDGPLLSGTLPIPMLLVDLRTYTPPADFLNALTDLTTWCIRAFASLTPVPSAAAVMVRHHPAPSGRVSDSLFAEIALCGLRGLVRQLRYDRSWLQTPLIFADAGSIGDEEIVSLAKALAHGEGRVEVERSSGVTVASSWKRGQSL